MGDHGAKKLWGSDSEARAVTRLADTSQFRGEKLDNPQPFRAHNYHHVMHKTKECSSLRPTLCGVGRKEAKESTHQWLRHLL